MNSIRSFIFTTLAAILVCNLDPAGHVMTAGDEAVAAENQGQVVRPIEGSQPPKDLDVDDEVALREASARRILQENCLICHSEDVITAQRLTPAQWQSEVEKMVNWGAPLPKEAERPLIDYLALRFSDRMEAPFPKRTALRDVGSLELPGPRSGSIQIVGELERGGRLYSANCATCHGPTALGAELGPSLAGKAILAHAQDYDRIVHQGLRRMPGFQLSMSPQDQVDVLAWLRARSYPAPGAAGQP
jgi:ubiquinol-cytochrome c reductase cytochrome c subunit